MDCILNNLSYHRVADMANVYASASCSSHINNILCSDIFCPYVMRIQEVTNLLFICSSFFCFCFFFSLKNLSIFLTMESAKCSIRF